ncbi:MAG: UDP-N-acetylmuramoyl-tripeptide--D-alanyl-D-alanine ligase [Patescibacteria group bacterium]
MKKIIQNILAKLAHAIILKQKPYVVAITGSVGKTSTKEAIFAVLDRQFEVRQSQENYNNEFGVPLTIIGAKSAGKSILGWLGVICQACLLACFKTSKYPQVLVLEMGADKPGDIEYLTNIVQPLVSVVTAVAPVHVEYFKSIENITKEKSVLVKKVNPAGMTILNADDELVLMMNRLSSAQVKLFGFSSKADVRAENLSINYDFSDESKALGISFKLEVEGKSMPAFLNGSIGKHQIYAILAAVSVGIFFKMNLVDITEALNNYKPTSGRMRIIKGIKNSILIDDTYNSSPRSCSAAILTLEEIPKYGRKFAILGDMLELGKVSEKEHFKIGQQVASGDIEYLICVGERSRDIVRGAEDADMSEDKIFHFDKSDEVGDFLKDRLRENDIILIKGSQGVRMEKVTRDLMADPLRAEELLVRQSEKWLEK